ncbi:hypothetical protein AB835_10525 [Candidatus Endobugula sertula]|uniref:DUF2059 domain-containing protein n=1 Tax=Candidatus Endobugula sertula TaxID=62101 RepID=A0A1D2QNJ3_9GAMM|nr:hypothetical protein AB835_10525 [Candidatus Endobugula sertula]
MNILKFLIIGVTLILATTSSVYAEEDHKVLAIEYLKLSKAKETVDMTIEAYVEQLSSQKPHSNKESIRTFFNTYMGWEVLKEPAIKLVSDSLSVNELKDINNFYKTDTGRSLAKKSPKMAADLSNLIAVNLQKAMKSM